jgi:hypothetical protein
MVIELPEKLEAALKFEANAQGMSADTYVREMLERKFAAALAVPRRPLKTGYGSLAMYGPAPSAEEIDENARDMFKNFGEDF